MQRWRRCWLWFWRSQEARWRFTLLFTALFVGFLIWGNTQHELWRDEIHPWIVARTADGFGDIATGDRIYDGHPPGWYWYLRLWTFITPSLWGLRAANVVVMGAAALLLLRYGPFPRPIKVLLLFSYLFGYEYGALSRNYSLGVLFTFLFCALLHPLKPRSLLLGLALGLLAMTSIYGVIIAASLLLVVVAEGSRFRESELRPGLLAFQFEPGLLPACAVVLLSIGFTYYTTTPPDPNPFAPGWDFSALNAHGVKATAQRLVMTFLPAGKFGDPEYWNGAGYLWAEHPQWLSVAVWVLPASLLIALVPGSVEVAAFALGVALMAVVQLTRYPGGLRHWGHYFILFIGLCWISRTRAPQRRHFFMVLVLIAIGAPHLRFLMIASAEEHKQIFAGGSYIADRIQRANLQDLPIVGGPDAGVLSVTGYLDRPFISSQSEEIGQTMVFHARRRPFSPAALVEKAVAVADQRGSDVLVLSMSPLPQPETEVGAFVFLFSNDPPAHDENYYVYRLTPVAHPQAK